MPGAFGAPGLHLGWAPVGPREKNVGFEQNKGPLWGIPEGHILDVFWTLFSSMFWNPLCSDLGKKLIEF